MHIDAIVPEFAKPWLRPLWRKVKLIQKAMISTRSPEQLRNYWANPPDAANKPETYLEGRERSEFLLEFMRKHIPSDSSILEIGCNVGRNLDCIFQGGYVNLSGIEINQQALEVFKRIFPQAAGSTQLFVGPMEQVLPKMGDGAVDAIYTMAVLEHLHPDNCAHVFSQIARISRRWLITIENEKATSWKAFARPYHDIFESLGFRQLEERACRGLPGMGDNYTARIFARR